MTRLAVSVWHNPFVAPSKILYARAPRFHIVIKLSCVTDRFIERVGDTERMHKHTN